MKDAVEKTEKTETNIHEHSPSTHHESHAHTSSEPLLKKNKTFGWLQAAIIVIPLIMVGIFIVVNTFAATLSPHTQTVQNIYKSLLGRTPAASDSGIQYWAKKMDAGSSQASVESSIKATSEYKSKHATTNTQPTPTRDSKTTTRTIANSKLTDSQADTAVRAAYRDILHKTPDAAGLAFWKKQLTSGTQSVASMNAYFKSKVTITKTNSAKPASASSCEATLLKGYILTGTSRNFFGGDGSIVGAKAAALRDSAENIVRAADRKYLGIRHPYSTANVTWDLTNQEVTDVNNLSTCKISISAYIANLSNSAASKAWLSQLNNINTTIVAPIRAAYNALPAGASGKVIYPDTWILWVLQGKMSVDEAVAQINGHTAGYDENGAPVSAEDLAPIQAQADAQTAEAQQQRASGSSSNASSGVNPINPGSGNNKVTW